MRNTDNSGLAHVPGTSDTSHAAHVSPLQFNCAGHLLQGILHHGSADSKQALLVVVGGFQYRIGAHRQFIKLARAVAALGIPVLRFDPRGLGDNLGCHPGLGQMPIDIKAAVDALHNACPNVQRVCLWGLCDGASAALMYANNDPRVTSVVLVNPWLGDLDDSDMLRGYYVQRLLSKSFWKNLVSGRVTWKSYIPGILNTRASAAEGATSVAATSGSKVAGETAPDSNWSDSVTTAFQNYAGSVLLIVAGNDLTGNTFKRKLKLGKLLPATTTFGNFSAENMRSKRRKMRELAGADHTFSRAEWHADLQQWTIDWLLKQRH